MRTVPSAKPLFEAMEKLRQEIREIESRIHSINPKYVRADQIDSVTLNYLTNGGMTTIRRSRAARESTLGATLLTTKVRPFEWAARDRNPEVKALARERTRLKQESERIQSEIDPLSYHSAWIEYARQNGFPIPCVMDYPEEGGHSCDLRP